MPPGGPPGRSMESGSMPWCRTRMGPAAARWTSISRAARSRRRRGRRAAWSTASAEERAIRSPSASARGHDPQAGDGGRYEIAHWHDDAERVEQVRAQLRNAAGAGASRQVRAVLHAGHVHGRRPGGARRARRARRGRGDEGGADLGGRAARAGDTISAPRARPRRVDHRWNGRAAVRGRYRRRNHRSPVLERVTESTRTTSLKAGVLLSYTRGWPQRGRGRS